MGRLLKETELSKGGRPTENQLPRVTSLPKLSEIGISKRQSSNWQEEAVRLITKNITKVKNLVFEE